MAEKQYRKVKILIASTSDVQKERDYAVEVIRYWNAQNSDEQKLVLEAVLWESHSAPEAGDRVQGILNKQIVDQCDGAIGIFWTRIGTDTGVALGGAVEELERLESMGKPVMIYFSLDRLPHDVDIDQLQKVRAFKAKRQCKGDLLGDYEDPDDFRWQLNQHLGIQVKRWFLSINKMTADQRLQSFSHLNIERPFRKTQYDILSKIRLLGSPDIDSMQVKLDDTFVPLRISNTWQSDKRFDKAKSDVIQRNIDCYTPDQLMQRVFSEYRMLLVIGDPGSGKTTLMKYYAVCCLLNQSQKLFVDNRPTRVFYLPMRELSLDDKAQYYPLPLQLSLWAEKHTHSIEKRVFERWLRDEQFRTLVLLDGLDEISDLVKRKKVCGWIDRAWSGFSDTYFVVTSRSTGYRKAEGIELTADHIRADVMDFTPEQQEEFLTKWFNAAYQRELCPKEMVQDQWIIRQKTHAKERTAKIVEYLKKPENKGLRELAAVPMILQIMAILWKVRDFLPVNRVKLYSAALDYLLEFRDERRMILPILPSDKARRVLAPVSLWMQQELEADEVEREAMHAKMQEKLKTFDDPPTSEAFCRNLVDRAGLLADYGDREYYVFRHKTFREYLAGVQLKEERHKYNRVNRLIAHFGEDWWTETFRFFIAQVDEDTFDLFMHKLFESEVSEELSVKQQGLLQTLIAEAPEKKTDSLCEKLLDPEPLNNRQLYILDCLKAMGKKEVLETLYQFRLNHEMEMEKWENRGESYEHQVPLRYILDRVEDVILSIESSSDKKSHRVTVTSKGLSSTNPKARQVFRNSYEDDAQYILIPGGKYIFSKTNQEVEVTDQYVAKYPVTNRRFCFFIDFLAGRASEYYPMLSIQTYTDALYDLAKSKVYSLKGFDRHLKEKRVLSELFYSYGNKDRRFNSDDQPVVCVTWYAARAYCLWLSMLSGETHRLPDEKEWEWIAGGRRDQKNLVSKAKIYPWGDEPKPSAKYANYNQHEGATTPVGSYPDGSTPEGLYDIAGNVWEWINNWYRGDYAILSGGAWNSSSNALKCANNGQSFLPNVRANAIGFRVVRSSPASER